jgi:hypothetical protein
VGFFDAARVPPPPPRPRYRLPDWLAPPENVEPVTHDVRVVLAQTPHVTLTIDFVPLHASAAHAVELWRDDRDPPPTEHDVVI